MILWIVLCEIMWMYLWIGYVIFVNMLVEVLIFCEWVLNVGCCDVWIWLVYFLCEFVVRFDL